MLLRPPHGIQSFRFDVGTFTTGLEISHAGGEVCTIVCVLLEKFQKVQLTQQIASLNSIQNETLGRLLLGINLRRLQVDGPAVVGE